ncbi:hypothetical protein ACSMXN_02480 [Jatrophihabitans sp. DSM 45814]
MTEPIDLARNVADTVLYEGYLLYPYRASAKKNQIRWQFGVLGPPGARSGASEPASLGAQCVLAGAEDASVTLHLRFLQLQARRVQQLIEGSFVATTELLAAGETWTSWDEAVPQEISIGPLLLKDLVDQKALPVRVPESEQIEAITADGETPLGRLVRRRESLLAEVLIRALPLAMTPVQGDPAKRCFQLDVRVQNQTPGEPADRASASALSFLGTHLLLESAQSRFISLLDPPPWAAAAIDACSSERCWPIMASDDDDIMLISPIILYDHPELAAQSPGALFDATEIDEILTLRVMTMTDTEKAEARATDPHAAAIIDRCDAMSAADLQSLHGILRDPHGLDDRRHGADDQRFDVPTWSDTGGRPWWDPGVDASVDPEHDSLMIGGSRVSRGSRVLVHPLRRADAQDIFFAGKAATVAAVFADVDGNDHVAVVLSEDDKANPDDWYGRYLYFAPEELEPINSAREE